MVVVWLQVIDERWLNSDEFRRWRQLGQRGMNWGGWDRFGHRVIFIQTFSAIPWPAPAAPLLLARAEVDAWVRWIHPRIHLDASRKKIRTRSTVAFWIYWICVYLLWNRNLQPSILQIPLPNFEICQNRSCRPNIGYNFSFRNMFKFGHYHIQKLLWTGQVHEIFRIFRIPIQTASLWIWFWTPCYTFPFEQMAPM